METKADPSIELYGFPSELIAKVTKAARAADEAFKTVGGSTRHWVRECFLPCLEEEGLVVVAKEE